MRRRAVFLDRDGTINPDSGYIDSPEKIGIFPSARSGLRLLYQHDYLLFVVTNQSGVGRGFFPESALEPIHRKLLSEIERDGVKLTEIAYCPHHPDEKCKCRKPSPYLVLRLADRYGVDLSGSYFIGDKISDLLTGKNAGCGSILLAEDSRLSGLREIKEWVEPDYIAADLYQAAKWIVDPARNGFRAGNPKSE